MKRNLIILSCTVTPSHQMGHLMYSYPRPGHEKNKLFFSDSLQRSKFVIVFLCNVGELDDCPHICVGRKTCGSTEKKKQTQTQINQRKNGENGIMCGA